jgi:hypothetical protein
VPYTNTSVPFNTRLEELTTDHTGYTEMEFFVSGNANLYMKDATTGNAIVNTPNHPTRPGSWFVCRPIRVNSAATR